MGYTGFILRKWVHCEFLFPLGKVWLFPFQISYGSFEPATNDQIKRGFFYRMVPNEDLQYKGIIQLLLHFGWKWVGLITPNNEAGEHFLQIIEPMLFQNGICSEFTEKIEYNLHFTGNILHMVGETRLLTPVFMSSKANAVVIYGESTSILWLSSTIEVRNMIQLILPPSKRKQPGGKVWITTAQIDFILYAFKKIIEINVQMFHGAISSAIHSNEIQDFSEFLRSVKPSWADADGFINDFWGQAFSCSLSNSTASEDTCTGEELLESLPSPFFEMSMTGHSYSIYNAVYALAHALHIRYSSEAISKRTKGGDSLSSQNVEPWQVMFPLIKCSSCKVFSVLHCVDNIM
uniref:vomeronasal type-2 receptor 26-like n=1 Tax=Podarcis muralis TaxID=64176 RepID=UPI00109FED69|nr:vomeronasal type-2 receptor 26-like [Podarcis muralis]